MNQKLIVLDTKSVSFLTLAKRHTHLYEGVDMVNIESNKFTYVLRLI